MIARLRWPHLSEQVKPIYKWNPASEVNLPSVVAGGYSRTSPAVFRHG